MKNDTFNIQFDSSNAGISSIQHSADKFQMNWCEGIGTWGTVQGAEMISCIPLENKMDAVYKKNSLEIDVTRSFTPDGNYRESYIFKNTGDCDLFFKRGDIGIYATFNDNYEAADVCMTQRCHTHLWCGEDVSYVNALRMGISDINLGLVVTKGALSAYSIERDLKHVSNDRGDFILHPVPFSLMKGESYALEWELFWHKGYDFYDKLLSYPGTLLLSSAQDTVFEGESIEITGKMAGEIKKTSVILDGKILETEVIRNSVKLSYRPQRLGEHKFEFAVNGISTFIRCNVVAKLDDLIRKRIQFITGKQQFHKPDSPLDGAYLIYDNEDECLFFDKSFRDHNASRERLGMGILIARYLQVHSDEHIMESLVKFERFVRREFFDENTGKVFDEIGKDPTHLRLYNAPWMSTFWLEMFFLKKEDIYLDFIYKTLLYYYESGGSRFYPNGLSLKETVLAFRANKREAEAQEILDFYRVHVENIIKNGTDYPKHEVNFEQTIVTPAATFISSFYNLCPSARFLQEAKKHIEILERFNCQQPDYHLNEIPIRHWDDYWFGKRKLFGDTFPHYWSCLSARSFKEYYDISGETIYLEKARRCLRNCLCLFTPEGRASCAYVYPYKVNGIRGEFYDEWANDQDFALYFVLKLWGEIL